MSRIAAIALVSSGPAFAHDGLHHHPHGIELGWIVAAMAAIVGALGLAALRRRK